MSQIRTRDGYLCAMAPPSRLNQEIKVKTLFFQILKSKKIPELSPGNCRYITNLRSIKTFFRKEKIVKAEHLDDLLHLDRTDVTGRSKINSEKKKFRIFFDKNK